LRLTRWSWSVRRFFFWGSAMDDNRMPPADVSRDFYPRGGQYVTQEQMHAEMTAFRTEILASLKRLEESMKDARTEAIEAHHRMREDWQLLLKDSIKYGARLNQIEDDVAQAVTKDQFEPVRMLVYGLVALMLTGVIGALMALLLRKP
jgi:hypothetical protein